MRTHPARTTVAGLTLGLAALTACSSSHHPAHPPPATAGQSVPTGTARASVGDLTITGGYIPQPASPDVAAAYFTVSNSGPSPDTLTKITTNVTNRKMNVTLGGW